LAQRVQDERAAVVDLQVEQVVGVDRGATRPESWRHWSLCR
jgi:hypothetical protein